MYRSLCNFGPLNEVAYKYIVKEFMTVAEQSDELMKLTKDEFKLIIQDNRLNIKCEEYVWEVLLKWVDHLPKYRKNDLASLLPYVRFGLMDSRYFIEKVSVIVIIYLHCSQKL